MQGTTTESVAPASKSAYLIAGQQFRTDSPGFAEAIAAAHAEHHWPRCLCLHGGIEMYVARLGDGFIVKRMPDTGSQHAPDCPSYESPPELSGLGQVLGSAINEDPATGETTLNLGFSMSKIGGRSTIPATGGAGDSVVSDGTKLSLRALLHYLWDQAELTRWHPGFAGKRSWATVRRHLLQAAENKIARGGALAARLYIPEVFSIEQRDAINARRLAHWARVVAAPGKPQNLLLLIGEVKDITPARYGFKAVIKHVPDQAFALDEQLYRRLCRRFDPELSLWGATDNLHVVMIATFGVKEAGVPAITEMSLMAVTGHWLPIEDGFEQQLVERLVHEGRSFVKGLRYDMPRGNPIATATLTDAADSPVVLVIGDDQSDDGRPRFARKSIEAFSAVNHWVWYPTQDAAPPLPRGIRFAPTRGGSALPNTSSRASQNPHG